MNWNTKQQLCLDLDMNGENAYIFGPGGTGKSTIIKEISTPNSIILAPTGIAANHIEGRTIHKFSRLGNESIFLPEIDDEFFLEKVKKAEKKMGKEDKKRNIIKEKPFKFKKK